MAQPDPFLKLPPLPPTTREVLRGPNEPLREDSVEDGPFDVVGSIPPGINGLLVLIGPNPAIVDDPETYHPSQASGMVHSVGFDEGRPDEERSRFVVTRSLVDRLGMTPPRGPLSAGGPSANRAVAVVARRLLALDGQGLGYRLAPSLATIAVEDFDGMLATSMGTQVQSDPRTGDCSFLGLDPWRRPLLHLHDVRSDGLLAETSTVSLDPIGLEPAFGVTEGLRFLVESSVRADVDPATGRGLTTHHFDSNRPAHLGLLPVGRSQDDIRWCDLAPGHTHSILSANNTAAGIDAVVVRSTPMRPGLSEWEPTCGRLERLVVDGALQRVNVEVLDDVDIVGASIDAAESSDRRRHCYATSADRRTIIKYNIRTGSAQRIELDEGLLASPPIFMRDPEGRADDEGWVIVPCFDRREIGSRLLVIEGTAFSSGSVAEIALPHRIPINVTGLFIARAIL